MGDNEASRIVTALEGELRAALVAGDDVAADDLAFSLAQDVALRDELLREGGSLLVGDVASPIEWIGHDFLASADHFVALDRAVVVIGGGPLPQQEPDLLISRLRRLARCKRHVAVRLFGARSEITGRLIKCTTEHVFISGAVRLAVPASEVAYVRLVRGGSGDVP